MGRPTFNNNPTKHSASQSSQEEAITAIMANAAGQQNDRVVTLWGEICEQLVSTAILQLVALAGQNSRDIHLLVSTYGGGMNEMFGLIDVMKMVHAPVCTVGIGKVMSAGTCILAAGAKGKRMCGRMTRIMIHSCAGGVGGNVWEILNEVDEIKRLQAFMVDTLVENTKMSREQVEEMMARKNDVYLSAEQAVELGIVDKIIG